ncbi:MAG: response regulator transcription factor [Pedobacter sp.]|nr:MAG: response regulator transcription factor [Pedobacter sp.]
MLKAVILDDETRGSNLLAHKLAHFADVLEVKAIFDSPFKTLATIKDINPDVIFLDVEMPGMNGFQFLETLGSFNFEIIFTTAYNHYALDALRLSALDYLLKPVDHDELQKAINRLCKRVAEKSQINHEKIKKAPCARMALTTAEGIYLVDRCNITRVEAMSNYSVFILSDSRKIVVSKTLKEYENILDDEHFMRINRSVIVNLDYVVKYRKGDGGTLEFADGTELEVSSLKKEELLKRLF